MKNSTKGILLALGFVAAIPVWLTYLLLESVPVVDSARVPNTDNAAEAKVLAKRLMREIRAVKQSTASLSLSENEINSIFTFASRGHGRIKGSVEIRNDLLTVAAAYQVRDRYLNFRAGVLPSSTGIELSGVQVGKVIFPKQLALTAVRRLMDATLGDKNGTVAFGAFRSIAFSNKTATVTVGPVPDILERKERLAKRFKKLRDVMPQEDNTEAIRAYYQLLLDRERGVSPGQSVSLAYFMGPLFREARARSVTSDPVEENRAALLALLLYAGNVKFEAFTGSVRTEEMKKRPARKILVTLSNRKDLRQHFIYSMGIKILTDTGISNAAGELKELIDSGRESGFSFVDLAADMAGVALAERATVDADSARKVQAALGDATSESVFFPKAADLPENIPKTTFDKVYGDVEGPRYRQIVGKIRRRISSLPTQR